MNAAVASFRHSIRTVALAALVFSASAFAQDEKSPATGQVQTSASEQEAKLVATLTNATLKGRWAPVKDGQLGPEKEDAYQIVSIKKTEGDHWEINARIQYGGRTMDLPIPALVKWSGDTPVLLFDNINFGTPRSYSARLMVYGEAYAGTWSAGDHGGMLYGVISHETH